MSNEKNPPTLKQLQQPQLRQGIQVICAGMGRTGTLSLTDALEILGYKPYHFIDMAHHSDWAQVADGTKSRDEIINRLVAEGYTATLDNPTCDIYQDLLRRYPHAKVIVTVRDSPLQFVKSWRILLDTMSITEQTFSWTFPSFLGYIPLFAHLKKIRYFMGTTHLGLKPGQLTHGFRDQSEEWLVEQYTRHNQHVIDHVPDQQLLVFNVKQGWEPLCQFLQKPVPGQPFPHSQVNTAESLQSLRQIFLIIVYGWIPTLVAMVGAGAAVYLQGSKSTKNLD
jgi:hypothetical protein